MPNDVVREKNETVVFTTKPALLMMQVCPPMHGADFPHFPHSFSAKKTKRGARCY